MAKWLLAAILLSACDFRPISAREGPPAPTMELPAPPAPTMMTADTDADDDGVLDADDCAPTDASRSTFVLVYKDADGDGVTSVSGVSECAPAGQTPGTDACDNDARNDTAQGCSQCADADADGYFAHCDRYSAAAPGIDCADDNPSWAMPVPTGAFGCSGLFVAANDEFGVFVSPSGNDSAAGTRAAPLRTFTAALTRGKVVFAQSGAYPDEQLFPKVSIIAGLNSSWGISSSYSVLDTTNMADSADVAVLTNNTAIALVGLRHDGGGAKIVGTHATGLSVNNARLYGNNLSFGPRESSHASGALEEMIGLDVSGSSKVFMRQGYFAGRMVEPTGLSPANRHASALGVRVMGTSQLEFGLQKNSSITSAIGSVVPSDGRAGGILAKNSSQVQVNIAFVYGGWAGDLDATNDIGADPNVFAISLKDQVAFECHYTSLVAWGTYLTATPAWTPTVGKIYAASVFEHGSSTRAWVERCVFAPTYRTSLPFVGVSATTGVPDYSNAIYHTGSGALDVVTSVIDAGLATGTNSPRGVHAMTSNSAATARFINNTVFAGPDARQPLLFESIAAGQRLLLANNFIWLDDNGSDPDRDIFRTAGTGGVFIANAIHNESACILRAAGACYDPSPLIDCDDDDQCTRSSLNVTSTGTMCGNNNPVASSAPTGPQCKDTGYDPASLSTLTGVTADNYSTQQYEPTSPSELLMPPFDIGPFKL